MQDAICYKARAVFYPTQFRGIIEIFNDVRKLIENIPNFITPINVSHLNFIDIFLIKGCYSFSV